MHIQPGIESLGSRVLDLMDKGVTGARNVRTLRECENHAPTCSWNLLYGFPGECAEDYAPVIEQLPALVHLPAAERRPPHPAGAVQPALHRPGPRLRQAPPGRDVPASLYDLPEDELADLVYLLDTEPAGIGGAVERRLKEVVAAWRAGHAHSRLLFEEGRRGAAGARPPARPAPGHAPLRRLARRGPAPPGGRPDRTRAATGCRPPAATRCRWRTWRHGCGTPSGWACCSGDGAAHVSQPTWGEPFRPPEGAR
ncbi:hypothetical protein LT493_30020 [Streptomyces tricolor]|nr:hypothetical protein [Streptomyces tricolor]